MALEEGEQLANQDDWIIVVKTPEKIRAEDLERLDNFRWIDDTFARPAFKDKPELAEFVLRIITQIHDLVIDHIELRNSYMFRDIFCPIGTVTVSC